MTMNIHIPPAALEAGAEVCRDYRRANVKSEVMARAAFVAMVKAWPGMRKDWTSAFADEVALILPLTENPDDKA